MRFGAILVFVLDMKRHESSDRMNILYKGRRIYQNLSYEEVTEVLDEMASQYYDNGVFDPLEIELEVIENGTSS